MEIINYVGYGGKSYTPGFEAARRFVAWLSQKNRDYGIKRHSETSVLAGISKTARSFSVAARPSRGEFSVRAVLAAAGRSADLIHKNAIKILLVLAALLAASGILWGAVKISMYADSHTNPLVLQGDDTEIELLDAIMKAFASEEIPDYASDGSLSGAETDVSDISKIFTQAVTFKSYKVQSGDTISAITRKFGLKNISSIIALNGIENVRLLSAGQKLKIPSMDGLPYRVQPGNTLQGLSAKYGVSMEELLDVNDLESANLKVGQELFIPGARMSREALQEALGEFFKCPITARFRYTSMFGPRLDPISGARSNHTGVDMACPTGTPVYASSPGTVAFVGYSNIFGNYMIVKHSKGYQTLYGHLSKINAKKGQAVSQDTNIGLVGNTGYSTGPHLHFTVYRNGQLVDPMTLIKK